MLKETRIVFRISVAKALSSINSSLPVSLIGKQYKSGSDYLDDNINIYMKQKDVSIL